MTFIEYLLVALCIMMATEGWNQHLKRDRRTEYYREEEIRDTADSLLNNWAKWEMEKDSL